jgi:uncharacterized protein HemY
MKYHESIRMVPNGPSASWACVILLLTTLSACTPPAQHPEKPMDYLAVGMELRQRGDHLNAGYWLEAALPSHPGKEAYLLRLIVEEQILSGRLLAARSGLERLRTIHGDSPAILQLMAAIHHGAQYSLTEKTDSSSEVIR